MNARKDDPMKKLAFVDHKICVACGACMKACPKDAISIYCGCYAAVNQYTHLRSPRIFGQQSSFGHRKYITTMATGICLPVSNQKIVVEGHKF